MRTFCTSFFVVLGLYIHTKSENPKPIIAEWYARDEAGNPSKVVTLIRIQQLFSLIFFIEKNKDQVMVFLLFM